MSAPGVLPKAVKTRSCSGTTHRRDTPPGDAPDMASTVVSPKGYRTQPSPIGGTFGLSMSYETCHISATDSADRTRVPDGAMPPARWVRPKASRSATVPIGVPPAGPQVSGSVNMFVGRSSPVSGSGKWPTAVLRRMACSADVLESFMPTGA